MYNIFLIFNENAVIIFRKISQHLTLMSLSYRNLVNSKYTNQTDVIYYLKERDAFHQNGSFLSLINALKTNV